MTNIDQQKQEAAYRAVEFIQSGMTVGLGTGSTVNFALERFAERLKSGQLKNILGIPSSIHTEQLAGSLSIPLATFEERRVIDITIDGADEVDTNLDLIKGGGGALLREKILAQASRRNIIIVDESKLSRQLGTHCSLPLEVLPFAWPLINEYVQALGVQATLRKKENGEIYLTDQNNWIIDAQFGPIEDPAQLGRLLNQRAGIVEHGLFLGLATDVIVAGKERVRILQRI